MNQQKWIEWISTNDIINKFGSASSHSIAGASEPRGVLTESHPASAGLPTFVASWQKWVGVWGETLK